MTTTPPGWYDDGHGAMRWWDGSRWTEHVALPDPEPAEYAEATAENAGQATATYAEHPTAAYPEQPTAAYPEQPTAAYPEQPTAVTVPLSPVEYPLVATAPRLPAGPPDAATAGRYEAPGTAPYPGGHPGAGPAGYGSAYPTDGGAFIAATEPRMSRLWIVWVVLGVIVLGVVVALAVAIPILFLGLTTGAGSSEGTSGGTSTEEPAEIDPPSGADEQAAAAAVELFNDSILSNDCAGYFASTTDVYRNALQVVDCDEFAEATESFANDFQDYELTVTSVEQDGNSISVYTTETYSSPFDDEGEELADPQEYEDHFRYIVVGSVDGWLVDESYSIDE